MSFFDQSAADSVKRVLPSSGERLDFLTAFGMSYDATARAASELSVSEGLVYEIEQEARKMRAQGLVVPDGFGGPGNLFHPLTDYARALEGQDVAQSARDEMGRWDKAIGEAKARDPSLRTMGELWQAVKQRAADAEAQWDASVTTTSGMFGGFFGGLAAGVNPALNPFGFATMGFGGWGKNAFMRIGTEAGMQGAVSGIQELTGVAADRQLLGLQEHNVLEAMALGALGGGVIRGAGEGLGALAARARQGKVELAKPEPAAPTIVPTVEPPPFKPEPIGPRISADISDELPMPPALSRWEMARHEIDFTQVKSVLDDPTEGLGRLRIELDAPRDDRTALLQGGAPLVQSGAILEHQVFQADPQLHAAIVSRNEAVRTAVHRLSFGDAIAPATVQKLTRELEQATQEYMQVARRAADPQTHARIDAVEKLIPQLEQRIKAAGFAVPAAKEAAVAQLAIAVAERELLRPLADRAARIAERELPAGRSFQEPAAFQAQYVLPDKAFTPQGGFSGWSAVSDGVAATQRATPPPTTAGEHVAAVKAAADAMDGDVEKLIAEARKRLDGGEFQPHARPEVEKALKMIADDQAMLRAMETCAR